MPHRPLRRVRARIIFVLLALLLSTTLALLPGSHAQSPDARVIRADLAVSDDGATVATSTGTGTLLLWNASTWTLIRQHTADGSQVFGFDFTSDGRYVAFGTKNGRLAVLDVSTGRIVFATQDRDGSVNATRFGPDDRLFAAGQGRWLTSYNWRSGDTLQRYDLGREVMPDGRRLVVEDFEVVPERGWLFIARFDQQARLMDIASGEVVQTWRNKRRPRDGGRNVKDVEVLPDGRTGFFAGVGGDVVAVDLLSGARLDSVRAHPDFVSDLELSANGDLLAANDLDGNTTLISTDTRFIVRRSSQDGSFQSGRLLFAAAFRPGTDELITGGIRMPIVVWNTTTGERRRTIASLP
ncbi:WD40 repeat domain-containing protein [Longibacter sp.]|uniref:WD40 repeat domain-containing protein n=1 Tax=Longibacter sp. TaxID=2045415 RepID=UPI003EBF8E2A